MWVTKLLISPVKIRIFCPKKSKFGPKLAFLFILGQALLAHLIPSWWLVGGCGARAITRKTPIYFTRISLNQICFWFSSLGSLFYHCFRYSTVTKQAHRPASISSRAVQHSIFNIQYSSLLIYHSILIIIRLFILFNIHVCSEWHTRFFFYIRGGCETPRQSRNLSHLLTYH